MSDRWTFRSTAISLMTPEARFCAHTTLHVITLTHNVLYLAPYTRLPYSSHMHCSVRPTSIFAQANISNNRFCIMPRMFYELFHIVACNFSRKKLSELNLIQAKSLCDSKKFISIRVNWARVQSPLAQRNCAAQNRSKYILDPNDDIVDEWCFTTFQLCRESLIEANTCNWIFVANNLCWTHSAAGWPPMQFIFMLWV